MIGFKSVFAMFLPFLLSGPSFSAIEEQKSETSSVGFGAEGLASISYIFLSKSQMVDMNHFPLLGNVNADHIFGFNGARIPNLLDMPSLGYITSDRLKISVLPPLTERTPFGVAASWRF